MEQTEDLTNDKPSSEKRETFRERWRNVEYRWKLLSTLWICLAFVTLGWIIAQRGPSFLDLQLNTDVDVEKGAAYFTAGAVGYVFGSLVGGVLLDKYNKKMILFISTLLMGVITAIVPWCFDYWWMIAVQVMSGITFGVIDTGGNAVTSRLWGSEVKTYMQVVHFCFAFGGILSPLATKPFLAKIDENITDSFDDVTSSSFTVHNTTSLTNIKSSAHSSLLYIPFSLSSAFAVLTALPFLYDFFSEKTHSKNQEGIKTTATDNNNLPPLPIFLKLLTLFLLGLMLLLYCGVEDSTAGFLTTFVVQQLEWTKQKGSDLTSLLWGTFALGRFSGIWAVNLLHSIKMILICCICIILSFIGLYLGTIFEIEACVWLFTGMVGASMSLVFPCIFTWIEEDITSVSAKIASFLLVMGTTGISLTPLVLGFTMTEYTPLSFLYVLLSTSVLLLTVFLALWLVVHFKIRVIIIEAQKRTVYDVHSDDSATRESPLV